MTEMQVTRDVAAPAARVWGVMTDLEKAPEILTGIQSVERLDDGSGFGVGTRWRETRTMFGREATEEMEVTAVDPGRSYTVEAQSRGARYRSTMTVEPAGDGSRLTMTFAAEPTGIIARIMAATIGKLVSGGMRKAIRRDLDDIAAAAEKG